MKNTAPFPNSATWSQLYDRYAPMMYGVLLQMTASDRLAENILQQVFVALHQAVMPQQLNAVLCLRHTYKVALQYLKTHSISIVQQNPFNAQYPNINLFYIETTTALHTAAEEEPVVKQLREEIKNLRQQQNTQLANM